MPNDRLTKQIFLHDYRMSNVNDNWSSDIRKIMSYMNADENFQKLSPCEITLAKSVMLNKYTEEWRENIKIKPKLRTYAKFKHDLTVPDYITSIHNRYVRSLIAKLRCGILQLHVETGRYNQVKLEDRICSLCQQNAVEDELHFLCHCDLYRDLRKELYDFVTTKNAAFSLLSDDDRFITLMSNFNKYIGKYMKNAWFKRKNNLFR